MQQKTIWFINCSYLPIYRSKIKLEGAFAGMLEISRSAPFRFAVRFAGVWSVSQWPLIRFGRTFTWSHRTQRCTNRRGAHGERSSCSRSRNGEQSPAKNLVTRSESKKRKIKTNSQWHLMASDARHLVWSQKLRWLWSEFVCFARFFSAIVW